MVSNKSTPPPESFISPAGDRRTASSFYIAALKSCSRSRNLPKVRQIHDTAKQTGSDSDARVAATLVSMYMKCGSIAEARQVFDSIPLPDAACWNALISGYTDNGEPEMALELFSSMRKSYSGANSRSFVAAIGACSALAAAEIGRKIDGKIVKVGSLRRGIEVHRLADASSDVLVEGNIYLANALVDLYVKCRCLSRAREIFDKMDHRDIVSWNVLILGYAQNGENELALEMFEKLAELKLGFELDSWSFVAAIKACSNLAAEEESKIEFLGYGVAIHRRASDRSCHTNIYVANALIDMYAKCGSMIDAMRVFEKMKPRDIVSWNALMMGYVENGDGDLALRVFEELLRSRCCRADRLTLIAAIKACGSIASREQDRRWNSLEVGMAVHSAARDEGFDLEDLFVASCLVDMYAKCRSMDDSRRVFDRMHHRDIVSWNSLIAGYANNDENGSALEIFEALVSQVGGGGVAPNGSTFVAAFKACGGLRSLETAMALHREALSMLDSSEWDEYLTSSLIDMYLKCGGLIDASRAFSIKTGNIVAWNVLILGYAENSDGRRALRLFQRMKREGCRPNRSTYVAVLKACSSGNDLDSGREVQARIYRDGFERDGVVAGCLIDLFGKAGDVVSAQRLFDSFQSDSTEIWSCLIAAYSRRGDANRVLELFHEMASSGSGSGSGSVRSKLNGVIALEVLTSCSHAGLVEAGKKFFREMPLRYGIVPELEHFHCVIDLLSRANQREEALEVIREMNRQWNFEVNEVTWTTVTGMAYVDSAYGDAALAQKHQWSRSD